MIVEWAFRSSMSDLTKLWHCYVSPAVLRSFLIHNSWPIRGMCYNTRERIGSAEFFRRNPRQLWSNVITSVNMVGNTSSMSVYLKLLLWPPSHEFHPVKDPKALLCLPWMQCDRPLALRTIAIFKLHFEIYTSDRFTQRVITHSSNIYLATA